jgi:DNA-binding transcriptional LysR family regulator
MNLDQLRIFLAVVEQGSFSRAAEALAVTQSTVSFHVKGLEKSLGARLLERGGGRVAATGRGRLLLRYAQRIVALADEADARVSEASRGGAGELHVAASTIPAEVLLPRVLPRFRAEHPSVHVVVSVSDSKRALAALLAGECELALTGAKPADKRASATRFAEDEIVLVARERGARFDAAAPLILREPGSGTQDVALELLARNGVARPNVAVEVGSSEAVKRCVLSGLGFAFVSLEAVRDELRRGELHRVPFAGTPVARSFYVVSRRSAPLEPAARSLRRLLVR